MLAGPRVWWTEATPRLETREEQIPGWRPLARPASRLAMPLFERDFYSFAEYEQDCTPMSYLRFRAPSASTLSVQALFGETRRLEQHQPLGP